MYFDRSGRSISERVWKALSLHTNFESRLLKRSFVGEFAVVTVWDGRDPDAGVSDRPLIFRTVLRHDPDEAIVWEIRTPSETEAMSAHDMLEHVAGQRDRFRP